MKKIDNKTWERFTEAHGKLDDVKSEIEALVEEFNAKLADLAAKANAAREGVFAALDDAANEAENYFEERSEKWQEGDAGQTYSEWKDELSNARDVISSDVTFEVEEVTSVSELDEMIAALDGGFRQSPED